MKTRKWATPLVAGALLVALTGSAFAQTVPGSVYYDQHAKSVNLPQATVAAELAKAGVKDVPADNWAAGPIAVLLQSGLLAPTASGDFEPEAAVTGTEGIAVFAKVLGIASPLDTPAVAAQKAVDAGLTTGTGGNTITRVEVARLLATALGITPKATVTEADYPFADFKFIPAADRGLMLALYEQGVFKGYEDGSFRPYGLMTRAEIAVLVDRILGALAAS